MAPRAGISISGPRSMFVALIYLLACIFHWDRNPYDLRSTVAGFCNYTLSTSRVVEGGVWMNIFLISDEVFYGLLQACAGKVLISRRPCGTFLKVIAPLCTLCGDHT